MAGVCFVPFTIAAFGAFPAVVAAPLAAFARSLEDQPRLGEVLVGGVRGSLTVLGMSILAIAPGSLIGAGVGFSLALFRGSLDAPPVVVLGLLLLVVIFLVLLGVWTFGRYILIALVAFFVDPEGVKRSYVVFLDAEIKGHEAVIFATGVLPLVGGIAIAGQGLIPAVALPAEVEGVLALVAGVAIAFGSLAVATAAYAVIDAARSDPSLAK
jgi:hypothetical protein